MLGLTRDCATSDLVVEAVSQSVRVDARAAAGADVECDRQRRRFLATEATATLACATSIGFDWCVRFCFLLLQCSQLSLVLAGIVMLVGPWLYSRLRKQQQQRAVRVRRRPASAHAFE
jgi:hypothetical protein